MNQPVPNVDAADVERVARRDFPPDQVAEVLAALGEYGGKEWHREVPRVRLAILKLAQGDLARLRENVAIAGRDYRDVLAFAEYPAYFNDTTPANTNDAKRQDAIDADWQQYRRWFEKK